MRVATKIVDAAPKLGRSKTIAKKEQKKFACIKTATDAVTIVPQIFVVENQGTLSDCYQFVKQLGQGTTDNREISGSYGTVYEVVHKKTGEKRAIKMINKNTVPKERENELMVEINVLKEMVSILTYKS